MAGIVLWRFGRIFFLFLAGVSLLLCVAAAGLWVRSYAAAQNVYRRSAQSTLIAAVSRGECGVLILGDGEGGLNSTGDGAADWEWSREPSSDLLEVPAGYFPEAPPPVAGFFFSRVVGSVDSRMMILLPMGFVVTLTALLPLSAAVSIRRLRAKRRRLSAGCCPGCGYDCRATPGRCSECGRVFAAAGAGGAAAELQARTPAPPSERQNAVPD
ncbi:MAG: hypothetical protein JWN40_3760 [Phycisphaerales bacterium]|nr:hypothetical protein [Phycisphaerales bacterium]